VELFDNLLLGLSVAVSPVNLAWLFLGVMLGMIVGIIPGFGPAAALAVLLPVTFGMQPTGAVIMLAAIYYGSQYGGTITSILLNTPGESSSVASTFDGYPLAQQGRAGPALVMQAIASFVGGTFGVVLITVLAVPFTQLTRSFGPPEFFMIVMMGLATLIVMVGGNWRYGAISALAGFALGTVGVDLETGQSRFTFGSAEMIGGIDFIPIAIGLFGLGELYYAFYTGLHVSGTGGIVQFGKERRFWPERRDYAESRFALARGSLLGFCIGVIPGAGATVASLMSYALEKSVSRTPERFGKGAMAGLVGPESANNAASSGAMLPLLTLGIPGSGATAVLLAAFVLWGLTPGPLLMAQKPEFAWGLIASMYLGNVALLALNVFAIPLFVQMVKLPYRILAPAVILVCTIGTYSVNASIVETALMLAAGVFGFFMKRFGFSPAALVLALVLGPLAEQSLRQSLTISRGSLMIFVERPMCLWIVGVTAAVILAGILMGRRSAPS
jgi:putative tricarboxylic transport membrane protein